MQQHSEKSVSLAALFLKLRRFTHQKVTKKSRKIQEI
jgi:hypothetical protein